jgi:D-xylose 1-dehydrogenase (NADP+, D-xylono-1,5-lactone-forming)
MSVGWGVLGAGWLVGQATGAAIHNASGAHLQAAAARNIDRARATGARNAYDDYRAVLDDPGVDAVYICLSNEAHLPWILASLDAGKHVLCEKPMVLTEADAELAFDAADKAGLHLVEAVWTRWHPRMRRIVQVATSGALGSLETYLGTFTFTGVSDDNYRLSPLHGGGALYDVGIYPLHALMACLPDIESVTILDTAQLLSDRGVDLTTNASVTWSTGTRGSITGSFAMPPSQRLTVRGTGGTLRVEDDQAFASWREPTELIIDDIVEYFPAVDAYQLMFEEMSSRIAGGDGWLLPARDSLRVARIVDHIQHKAHS